MSEMSLMIVMGKRLRVFGSIFLRSLLAVDPVTDIRVVAHCDCTTYLDSLQWWPLGNENIRIALARAEGALSLAAAGGIYGIQIPHQLSPPPTRG